MNSPGGSAFASDVLAREIKKVRAAGKPIVVSMGDLAASGGYYIAAPADVIYAEPSTMTGSIGVFGYKVDAQKLLGTLGINVETYRRGAHADFLSPYRPWTEAERALAEQQIRAPLPAVRRDGGRRAPRARPHRRARRRARSRARLDRRAGAGAGPGRRMGGVSAAVDEAARLGGVPVGRDQLPELALLPVENKGLLRRLAGVTSVLDGPAVEAGRSSRYKEQDAPGDPIIAQPADLLTDDARAALRLLAPFLVQGNGSGFSARLPYDIDLR